MVPPNNDHLSTTSIILGYKCTRFTKVILYFDRHWKLILISFSIAFVLQILLNDVFVEKEEGSFFGYCKNALFRDQDVICQYIIIHKHAGTLLSVNCVIKASIFGGVFYCNLLSSGSISPTLWPKVQMHWHILFASERCHSASQTKLPLYLIVYTTKNYAKILCSMLYAVH